MSSRQAPPAYRRGRYLYQPQNIDNRLHKNRLIYTAVHETFRPGRFSARGGIHFLMGSYSSSSSAPAVGSKLTMMLCSVSMEASVTAVPKTLTWIRLGHSASSSTDSMASL